MFAARSATVGLMSHSFSRQKCMVKRMKNDRFGQRGVKYDRDLHFGMAMPDFARECAVTKYSHPVSNNNTGIGNTRQHRTRSIRKGIIISSLNQSQRYISNSTQECYYHVLEPDVSGRWA